VPSFFVWERRCFAGILPAAAAAGRGDAVVVAHTRREKLIGRELDLVKQLAGILVGADAFLQRDAEAAGRDNQGDLARNAHDREQTDGGKHDPARVCDIEGAVESCGDRFRNVGAEGMEMMGAVADVQQTRRERDGLDGFDRGLGHVGAEGRGVVAAAGILGCKDHRVAL